MFTIFDPRIYDVLSDEDIKERFNWSKAKQAYVAQAITFVELEEKADAEAYKTAKSVGYTGAGIIAVARQAPDILPLKVTRPFCP